MEKFDWQTAEPHGLDLDHAVHLVVAVERVAFVRAYAARMAWPPDHIECRPLDRGRTELRLIYSAGTNEYCFRVMARLIAQLGERDG